MSLSRAKVVIVDEDFPYPENSGKRIRSFNLIRRLAIDFDITYVAHQNADDREATLAKRHLQEIGIQTIEVSRKVPSKQGLAFYGRLAANLISSMPYTVAIHASSQMKSVLKRIDSECRVDLWHCEWTPYAKLFEIAPVRPLVV